MKRGEIRLENTSREIKKKGISLTYLGLDAVHIRIHANGILVKLPVNRLRFGRETGQTEGEAFEYGDQMLVPLDNFALL